MPGVSGEWFRPFAVTVSAVQAGAVGGVEADLERDRRFPAEGGPEIQRLVALHDAVLPAYKQDPKKAEGLLSTGQWPRPADLKPVEYGAWTVVARVILSLDETIVRE